MWRANVEEFNKQSKPTPSLDQFDQRAYKRILPPAILHGQKTGRTLAPRCFNQ